MAKKFLFQFFLLFTLLQIAFPREHNSGGLETMKHIQSEFLEKFHDEKHLLSNVIKKIPQYVRGIFESIEKKATQLDEKSKKLSLYLDQNKSDFLKGGKIWEKMKSYQDIFFDSLKKSFPFKFEKEQNDLQIFQKVSSEK